MASGGIVLLAALFSLSTFNVNFCHAIEFESSIYTYNISEEAVGAPGTLCALAILPVATSNTQDSVMYSFVDLEFSSLFHLTTNSNQEECLQNLDLLDREIRESYRFTYRASSSEGNADTTILLTLLDVNDHAPEFDRDSLQSFTVDENSDEGTLVGNITATDPDKAENGTVRYKLTRCNSVFELGERSGLLTVKSNIDYETSKSFECNVTATDSSQKIRSNYVVFTVNVNNINDNAPNCSNPVLPSSVTENQSVVQIICSLVDADEVGTSNGNWSARVENDFDGTFSPFVASSTLFMRISNNTDREMQLEYDIVIHVTDQGMPEQVGTINVHIVVNDTNDNRPKCPPGQIVQVSESARNQIEFLGSVDCLDPDDSSNLKFSLRSVWRGGVQSSERSIIVTNSGEIRVVDPIDYDDHPEKTLTLYIAVTDGTFTTSVNVTVQIVDANDNPPCFSPREYNFSIQENSDVGSEVGSVRATDADSGSNSVVVYSIPSPANMIFSINATTGQITTRKVLDREEKDRYEFDVMASDGGGPLDTCSRAGILVHVTNLDDSCPNFRYNYTFEVKLNQEAGTVVGRISAANPEGEPTNAITYKLESAPPYIILQQTNSITRNLILKSNLNESHVGEETFMAVVSSTKPSCSGGERTYIVLRILGFDPVVGIDPPLWHIIVGAVAGLLLVIIVIIIIFIIGVCCCCVKRQKIITDTYPITNSPAPTSPLELKKHKSILKPCPSESPDLEDPRQKNSVRFVEVISTNDIHIFDREAPPLSPRLSNGHANSKILEDLDSPEPMHESSSSVGAFEEDSQSLISNSSFPHQLDISDNINLAYEVDLTPEEYCPPTPWCSAEAHLPFAPTNHFQPEHLSSFDRYYSTNNSTWYNVEQDIVGLPSSPQRPHYYYQETGTSVITSDDPDSRSDNFSMYTNPGTVIACGPIESLVVRLQQSQQTKRANLPVKSTVAKLCSSQKHWKDLGSKPCESDLLQLVGTCYNPKWKEFGIRMGISGNTCEGISQQKPGDPEAWLALLYKKWLSYEAGTGDKPRTWRTVLGALQKCGFPEVPVDQVPADQIFKLPGIRSKPCEADLLDLVGDFIDSKWQNFGIELGIRKNVCEGIRTQKLCIPKECFILLCSKWLSSEAGTGDKPRTWRTVLEAVRECGFPEVADQVEQSISKHPVLSSRPDLKGLTDLIGGKLGPKWSQLGHPLSIDGSIIAAIQASSDVDCFVDMMRMWLDGREGSGNHPRTWDTVLSGLVQIGNGNLAGKVERHLVAKSSQC